MKTFALISVVGLGLALALAQTGKGQPARFGDRKDNFAILDFTSSLIDGNLTEGFTFEFTGSPLRGYSRSQGLGFTSNKISGRAASDKKGGLVLKSAEATGSVNVTVTRSDAAGAQTTAKVTSARLTLVDGGDSAKVTMPGAFTYVQNDADARGKRTITMTGATGVLTLSSLVVRTKDPLQAATIAGPVKVVVDSTGKGSGGAAVQTEMTATGDRLTYDGAARTIILSGNVKFDGSQGEDGVGFSGELSADKLTVWLTTDFEVKNFRLEGGPGSGTVRQTGGTTGGGRHP